MEPPTVSPSFLQERTAFGTTPLYYQSISPSDLLQLLAISTTGIKGIEDLLIIDLQSQQEYSEVGERL